MILRNVLANKEPDVNNNKHIKWHCENTFLQSISKSFKVCSARIDTMRPPFGPLGADALMEVSGGYQRDLFINCCFNLVQTAKSLALHLSFDTGIEKKIVRSQVRRVRGVREDLSSGLQKECVCGKSH